MRQLETAFPGLIAKYPSHRLVQYRVDKSRLPELARFLHEKLQGRLALLFAVDCRPLEEKYEIQYLFSVDRHWVLVTVEVVGQDRLFTSITPSVHAAQWYEREIRDLFGLIPQGHPDLRRLVRHEHWPKGTHPLRKDFLWDKTIGRQQGEYRFRHIEGEGVFEVPVGPIHAGIIEPGHFRFSIVGEKVLRLEERLGYVHKGIERRFTELPILSGHRLAAIRSGELHLVPRPQHSADASRAPCRALFHRAGVDAEQRETV